MEDVTKRKLEAAGKMAFGAFRVVSSAATGLGMGLLGTALKNHGHIYAAQAIAKNGIEAGSRIFNEGRAEWDHANS